MNVAVFVSKPNIETVRQINGLYLRTWLHTYPNKERILQRI
jgi:hypothetical protein